MNEANEVNRDELFSEPYKKHLAGEMRKAFGYEGCPIVLVPKPRPKTIEPVRKFNPPDKKAAGRMNAFQQERRERYSRKPKSARAKPRQHGD